MAATAAHVDTTSAATAATSAATAAASAAAATSAATAAVASAASAATTRQLLGERGWSGVFLVKDIKRRQADVGNFLIAEKDFVTL